MMSPKVTKAKVQTVVVSLVVVLFVASALGYLFAPSGMLSIVGMKGNPQANFLLRTLAAALLALTPGAWAARRRDKTSGQRTVLIGLAATMRTRRRRPRALQAYGVVVIRACLV